MAALRADYFGSASFGMITGISSMVVMIGMLAGPLVAGILADHTGSHQTGFPCAGRLRALGSTFFLLARRPEPPHRAPAGVPQPTLSASGGGDACVTCQTTSTRARWRADASDESRVTRGASSASASAMYAAS